MTAPADQLADAVARVRARLAELPTSVDIETRLRALHEAAVDLHLSPQETLSPTPRAALSHAAAMLWQHAHACSPAAPRWLLVLLVRILLDPAVRCDALLTIADALDEASAAAAVDGLSALAAEFHCLANLPRDLAPRRV